MRGENQEFKKRVGELSDKLRRLNVERMIESRYPDVDMDLIDLESYSTDDETPREIFESVRPKLEMLSENDFSDMTEFDLQNELEKYDFMREKFRRGELND